MHVVGIASEEGCSATAINRLSDEFTQYYHQAKEPRFDSRMNEVLRVSGAAEGGVRGVWCPVCCKYSFHSYVLCPSCKERGVATFVVKGCSTDNCSGNLKKQSELKKLSDREIIAKCGNEVCSTISKSSVNEVHTTTAVDFIVGLVKYKLCDKIYPSTRGDLLTSVKYAREQQKLTKVNCLNIGCILKRMNEEELSGEIIPMHKGTVYAEQMQGGLSSALVKCTMETSPEVAVFDMSSAVNPALPIEETVHRQEEEPEEQLSAEEVDGFHKERIIQAQRERERSSTGTESHAVPSSDDAHETENSSTVVSKLLASLIT